MRILQRPKRPMRQTMLPLLTPRIRLRCGNICKSTQPAKTQMKSETGWKKLIRRTQIGQTSSLLMLFYKPIRRVNTPTRREGWSRSCSVIKALSSLPRRRVEGKRCKPTWNGPPTARPREELRREQGYFIAAKKGGSGEALQSYLNRPPNSPYSEQVRQKLSQLLDREAVLSVIHRYEESYNRQDLNGIVNLWPSCPDRIKKNLQASFHSGEKQKLQLEVQGDPDIKGNFAIVRSQDTRSGSLTSTASVTITLVRQSGGWVIQSGIF